MIVTEKLTINGKPFVRTYSDEDRQLLQEDTGRIFDVAVDVEGAVHTYREIGEPRELSAEEALAIILGGDMDA